MSAKPIPLITDLRYERRPDGDTEDRVCFRAIARAPDGCEFIGFPMLDRADEHSPATHRLIREHMQRSYATLVDGGLLGAIDNAYLWVVGVFHRAREIVGLWTA